MKTLSPDDTLDTLAHDFLREEEAERAARIAAAKTNLERLLAAGVASYFPEDEIATQARLAETKKMAEQLNISFAEAEAKLEHARAVNKVRLKLRMDVARNETYEEHVERRNTLFRGLPVRWGGITKVEGKRCTHRTTRREVGWVNKIGFRDLDAADKYGHWRFLCNRCGATAGLLRFSEPTSQTLLAEDILARSESHADIDADIDARLATFVAASDHAYVLADTELHNKLLREGQSQDHITLERAVMQTTYYWDRVGERNRLLEEGNRRHEAVHRVTRAG